MCNQAVELVFPLDSDDSAVAALAIQRIGGLVEKGEMTWLVDGRLIRPSSPPPTLFLGNAGTAVRFLSAVLTAKGIPCLIDGTERMRERPAGILLTALQELGGSIESTEQNDCPPLRISEGGLKGGQVEMSGEVSSQFFSGIMMAAPFASKDVLLKVQGEWLSKPYIVMTARLLKSFGIETEIRDREIFVPAGQSYRSPGRYPIEPDASAATYPLALGALHSTTVVIMDLGEDSLQGDVRFLEVLESMGCTVRRYSDRIEMTPPEKLSPLEEYNAGDIPDAAMTLVVLLAMTRGKSKLTGLKNLKFKECDRLSALETELRKVGAKVNAFDDGFEIEGIEVGDLRPAEIETYHDHRMAMCMSLIGTLYDGMTILDPSCVEKTYPNYFADLEKWLS